MKDCSNPVVLSVVGEMVVTLYIGTLQVGPSLDPPHPIVMLSIALLEEADKR